MPISLGVLFNFVVRVVILTVVAVLVTLIGVVVAAVVAAVVVVVEVVVVVVAVVLESVGVVELTVVDGNVAGVVGGAVVSHQQYLNQINTTASPTPSAHVSVQVRKFQCFFGWWFLGFVFD